MNLLVDGHNLIGQLPGISLDDPDDEARLVLMLRRYAAARRGRAVVVVFDRGVYGHPQHLEGYGVACVFARSPQDADAQLIRRIGAIAQPRQWTVVSSDRAVARAAADRGVRVVSSAAFARDLQALDQPRRRKAAAPGEKPERLTPAEVEEWLRLFGERGDGAPGT